MASYRWSGFAGSEWPLDPADAREIAVCYAREYTRQFLEQSGSSLHEQSPELAGLIACWTQREADFDTVWHYAFGRVRQAVLDRQPIGMALEAAAVLGLRLLTSNQRTAFRLTLGAPVRAVWEEWLLPQARSVVARSGSGSVALELTNGRSRRSIEFKRDGRAWVTTGCERLPTFQSGDIKATFLPPPAIKVIGCGVLEPRWPRRPEGLVEELAEAVTVIREHAPQFAPWIGNVLRYIIPVRAPRGMIRSASGAEDPGVIEMSFGCAPVAIAEMLVHECAHQYYHLLSRVRAIDDGSDATLYYSPVRRTGRPIDKIVLAYHAFANVLLFYRACQRSGLRDRGYCESNARALLPQLRQLETALHATRALTDIGTSLWAPLAERIGDS